MPLEVQPADAGSSSLTPEQSAKILARIDDQTITLGDFAAALEHMDPLDRLRYQSPARRRELLNDMINLRLLAKEAHDKGYDQDPTAQEAERQVLRNAMLAEARKGAMTPDQVPESDVHSYFEVHRADYKDPERRRASAIVLNDEATARQVLEQAKKAGTSPTAFGELVRARSVDPEAKSNVPVDLVGDLGMVSPPGDTRGENPKIKPEVRVALFAIPEIGQLYPQVVASGGQFYIVKLTQKTDPRGARFRRGGAHHPGEAVGGRGAAPARRAPRRAEDEVPRHRRRGGARHRARRRGRRRNALDPLLVAAPAPVTAAERPHDSPGDRGGSG